MPVIRASQYMLAPAKGPSAKFKPGEPAKLNKLNRLPPAETYAAVYYTDGCPRRLIEAQGKRRR